MTQSAGYFAAAAIALGHAIQLTSGFYGPSALAWLTVALACAAAGVRGGSKTRDFRAGVVGLLLAGILWQLATLYVSPPGLYPEPMNLRPFRAGIAVEAVLVALGMLPIPWLRTSWFPLLALLHVALGCWMILLSPSPAIDVVTVTNAACGALWHGHNPYAITFPNIYGHGTMFYAPGTVANGRVQFGYPYPPVSLLFVLPAYLLGDYRYALLAAIVGSGLLIAYARPSHHAQLAAALFLTTPRIFFVLQQGWSEPVSLLLVNLSVFAMIRRSDAVAWSAGLAIASKQYLIEGVPLLWNYLRQNMAGARRSMVLTLVVASVVTLPFFLWSPTAFANAVVLLQLREPFRADALSYLGWLARHGWPAPSFIWTAAAALLALAATATRRDDTPATFAGSFAFVTLVTFAFGRKAFCNYYFFVIGLLCCAVATSAMMANKKRTHGDAAFRPRA